MKERENSYRLVSKKYFCYICNKENKKMVKVSDYIEDAELYCDECGQGFCEFVDKHQPDPKE